MSARDSLFSSRIERDRDPLSDDDLARVFRYAPRGYSHSGLRRRVARIYAGTLSRARLNAIKDRYQAMREAHGGH